MLLRVADLRAPLGASRCATAAAASVYVTISGSWSAVRVVVAVREQLGDVEQTLVQRSGGDVGHRGVGIDVGVGAHCHDVRADGPAIGSVTDVTARCRRSAVTVTLSPVINVTVRTPRVRYRLRWGRGTSPGPAEAAGPMAVDTTRAADGDCQPASAGRRHAQRNLMDSMGWVSTQSAIRSHPCKGSPLALLCHVTKWTRAKRRIDIGKRDTLHGVTSRRLRNLRHRR